VRQPIYLAVWREEGELQRPSELDACGDDASSHELGPIERGATAPPRLVWAGRLRFRVGVFRRRRLAHILGSAEPSVSQGHLHPSTQYPELEFLFDGGNGSSELAQPAEERI
jgi:hypothetical protein